jgi:hypothetical protein
MHFEISHLIFSLFVLDIHAEHCGLMLIQGLAYNSKKNILYVADTENHALRYVHFRTSL